MPPIVEKYVIISDENTLIYLLVSQKQNAVEFNPMIKELYIERIKQDNKIIELKYSGTNFNLHDFKKVKLVTSDIITETRKYEPELPHIPFEYVEEIQLASIKINELPSDINDWFGDIALLIIYMINIDNLTQHIDKLNKDITQNDVRKNNKINKHAYERFTKVCS